MLNQRLLKLFLSWVILNLRVVAEGVETVSQLAYLGNYGCQIFQGYFFEKAIYGDIVWEKVNTKYKFLKRYAHDSNNQKNAEND